MENRIQEVQHPAVEAAVRLVIARSLHRPVNDHGTPPDGVAVHKAPDTAVPTMVAIVTHRKILVWGNYNFAVMDVGKNLVGPLRLHIGLQELFSTRREVITKRIIGRRRIAGHIRLVEPLPIQVYLLVDDFEAVSWNADDALDVVRVVLKRKLENDDVAPVNFTVRQEMVVPMAAPSEDEFIHEKVVAN